MKTIALFTILSLLTNCSNKAGKYSCSSKYDNIKISTYFFNEQYIRKFILIQNIGYGDENIVPVLVLEKSSNAPNLGFDGIVHRMNHEEYVKFLFCVKENLFENKGIIYIDSTNLKHGYSIKIKDSTETNNTFVYNKHLINSILINCLNK